VGYTDYQILLGTEVGILRREYGVSKISGGPCDILVLKPDIS
jgi:hypothetical protein